MLGFDGEYLVPKSQILKFSLETCKNSAVKHSIQKPFLLNFVNLFTSFCPGLSEKKNIFSFLPWSRSLEFTFSKNFSISKYQFAFQVDILGHLSCRKGLYMIYFNNYHFTFSSTNFIILLFQVRMTKCPFNCSRAVFIKRL